MRCEFVDSMAAESRSVQSDEGATGQFGLGCRRNGLGSCSLIEAFAIQTWSQFVQRRPVVSDRRSCYRRMPSSLRTTRTQTAPTTRHKGTRSLPGLHAADEICLGILAGVCIRYMRVRMPVAHKGEWRPKRRASKQNNKSRRRGRIPEK